MQDRQKELYQKQQQQQDQLKKIYQQQQDQLKKLYQQQQGLKPGQSRPGSFMDIKVGGQRITKRDGRTITDTTKGLGLTSAQMGKIATNVAGGTAFNPPLRS